MTKACSFSDFTATASTQVAQVAACATAVGEVTVHGDVLEAIDLTGLEAFYGSLSVKNATNAKSFVAPNLELVSGSLVLDSNTILDTVNLALLTTVGTLEFSALPHLESTGLTTGITSAENITISDTSFVNVNSINVFLLKIFNVNNNKDIELIDSGIKKITDTLSISSNSENLDVSLDLLTTANQVYFESINSLSVANLTSVNDSLTFETTSLDKISILKLTNIGGSLTIDGNDNLEEVSLPQVTSVGGVLVVKDNLKLESFEGLSKLKTVGGSATIDGAFNNVTFDALNRVSGAFNLTSTGDLSCSSFTKANKFTVEGNESCSGAKDETFSSGTKSDTSSSTGSSSSTSGSSSSTSSSSKKSDGAAASVPRLTAFVTLMMGLGVALY